MLLSSGLFGLVPLLVALVPFTVGAGKGLGSWWAGVPAEEELDEAGEWGRKPRISLTDMGNFLYCFICRQIPSAFFSISSIGMVRLMSLMCWKTTQSSLCNVTCVIYIQNYYSIC